jgi:hypothetical protein
MLISKPYMQRGAYATIRKGVNPAARVADVDNDPTVLAHSRALKATENTPAPRTGGSFGVLP